MMTGQSRRRNGSSQKSAQSDENNNVTKKIPNPSTLNASKKPKPNNSNADDLLVHEVIHFNHKNKFVFALLLYVTLTGGFLYLRGDITLQEIPNLGSVKELETSSVLPINETKGNEEHASSAIASSEEKIIANVTLPPKQDKGRKTQFNSAQKQKSRSRFPDFQPNIQNFLQPSPILSKSGKVEQKWKEMKPKRNISTTVRVFIMDNFLSSYECDGLMRVHNSHMTQHNAHDPIVCFSGEHTMKQYLKQTNVPWKSRVGWEDFMPGTYCLNESLSVQLDGKLSWSSSTSFYPGESKFSNTYENKVQQYTGFDARNGGKFQVTSYDQGVGYKLHTDCTEGNRDPRDRYSTILVYLQDVEKGGETIFTELGIKVKPRKGRALIWNNMDSEGNCDLTSYHKAAPVVKGKKFILQRWYYYQNFPMLGKRSNAPDLPVRTHELTPRVTCDEFESGSCRWYDEWNFDHLTSYSHDNSV